MNDVSTSVVSCLLVFTCGELCFAKLVVALLLLTNSDLCCFVVVENSKRCEMEYETATDERCLKNINHFDLDKYCDKAVAKQGSTIAASREEPVQRSWLFVYVQLPSRLAEVTMLSIVIYEALVGVSLGVRVLR